MERVTNEPGPAQHPSLAPQLSAFLRRRDPLPRLLGLGEPTHGDETFLTLRNDLFGHLVTEHGFVAIALETDATAARALDAYVRGETDDLDAALRAGFAHGFGRFPGNRDLLVRLRALNTDRPAADHVRCLGFDAAMELTEEDYRSGDHAQRRAVERTDRMADHLGAILAEIGGRGPVLVHAHNTHLHRGRSSLQLGPNRIEWLSIGGVLAERHAQAYAVVLTSCSAAPARGVPAAPSGTAEHRFDRLGADRVLLDRDQLTELLADPAEPLHVRDDLTPAMALGPLDPATLLDSTDVLIHIVRGDRGAVLTPDDLRRLLGALPGASVEIAGPGTGAPEAAWGDTFVTVQPDGDPDPRRMPFATIVESDYPGFDESSDLDRDDVYALNLGVGPQFFQGLLGFEPSEAGDHVDRFDPTAAGVLMPHPLYAAQGWVRVINPPAAQEVQLIALAEAAARRSRPRSH